ncbi:MAG: PHP domain-containing protein [Lutibacter sp.]|uniref:PHP domain-containing protein n=1 Tax=Lutibacter sp. TaxID=1925666 RepID=UPI001A04B6AB|nr:PHP domain-containing protein [Lutibacter sp.]NOR27510.1 PHP domain-containing protein [Lutibacter sp.]
MTLSPKFCHLHRHSSNCLDGNTIIYNCIKHNNSRETYRNDYTRLDKCKTIKYLYECKIGKGVGYTYKKYAIKVWDGENFVKSKIKDIVKSKYKKKLFEITTENGKKITASKLHKFLTPSGWKTLKVLKNNDYILCNGELKFKNYDWLKKKYNDENLNQEQIGDICGVNRKIISKWISKFKLKKTKSEWMKGHYVNPKTIEKIVNKKKQNRYNLPEPVTESNARNRSKRWFDIEKKCKICGTTKRIDIHHIDKNPMNWEENNLIALCKKHHRQKHSKYPYTAKKERITSIKYICTDYAYDIEVEHEKHNFIANGFIVHNSLLDGIGKHEDAAKRAKELNYKYLGISDHGNIDGLIKHQSACEKNDVIPIMGCELFIVPDATIQEKGDNRGHLTCWVANQTGWENLLKNLSYANLYGFYYRPRTDYEYFLNNCEGLCVGTACAGSFLTKPGGLDFFDKLYNKIGNDLYLEVMPHSLIEQSDLNALCCELAEEYDLKLCASQDCHYIYEDDAETQEVLLAMQTKTTWDDPKRWKFNITGLHLTTPKEMKKQFDKQCVLEYDEYNEAMKNTIEIAKKCENFRIEKKEISLPEVPRFKGMDEDDVLIDLCERGFKKIFSEEIKLRGEL